MGRPSRYSPEVRERAVRLVFKHEDQHDSQWAAIRSVAEKVGCSSETLRHWVRRAEQDQGRRPGLTTDERARVEAQEREIREPRRAPGRLRWRNALVIVQLTISLMLLVDAELFLGSFRREQSVKPGFGLEPTAIVSFQTPATGSRRTRGASTPRRLADCLRVLPGVEALGTISNLHLSPLSTNSSDCNIDGFANLDRQRRRRPTGAGPRRRRSPWFLVGVASHATVRTLGEAPQRRPSPVLEVVHAVADLVARTSIVPERTGPVVLETKTMERRLALLRLRSALRPRPVGIQLRFRVALRDGVRATVVKNFTMAELRCQRVRCGAAGRSHRVNVRRRMSSAASPR